MQAIQATGNKANVTKLMFLNKIFVELHVYS